MKNNCLVLNQPKLPFIIIVAMVTAMLAVSGCAQGVAADDVRSDLKRETSPQVELLELQELVKGNSDFAFRLYQELSREVGNLFYSPYSISSALSMVYAGARGETKQEMMEALEFTLPQDHLHPAFNALALELESRPEPIETFVGEQEGPELIVANSLWGQAGHPFLPEFLDILALNYDAGLRLVDFANAFKAARHTINAWVSDQTKRRIEDLIPPGALNSSTKLVLANAIYFNATWDEPFEFFNTKRGEFHLINGDQISVPMMYQDESFLYARGEEYQLIELPYVKREIVMDILLPNQGQFATVESLLDAKYVSRILTELDYQGMLLTMPKFKFESSFTLSDTLVEMGMPSAFTQGADFSGMDGTHDLEISEVLHKAYVSVDEEGTEATAASAVFAQVVSGMGPAIEVKIDRPFIFWIRDLPTGTILFVGRVLNPTQ